jgi:hypothetical protein
MEHIHPSSFYTYIIPPPLTSSCHSSFSKFIKRLGLLCMLLFVLSYGGAEPVSAQQNNTSGCLPGLVHYFGLDENTTGPYADYVSDATAFCATCPSPAEGLFAGAQQFVGQSKAQIQEVSNFEWGPNSSFTIELWMKSSAAAKENQVLIGREAEDSNMRWWLGIDKNGSPVFDMYDRSNIGFRTVAEEVKVNDGKWHHIAVVRDGRLRLNKLYIDGFAVRSFEYDYKDNFESASPVTIGHLNLENGYGYHGLLDELMVYNRALTETEMRGRYNGGAGDYCGPQLVKPKFMTEAITHGVEGQPYRYDANAVGNLKPLYTLISGPAGMAVSASTGEVVWTPAAAGDFKVTIKASNSAGEDVQTYTVSVKKGLGEKAGMLHHWMLHEISGTRFRDFYTPYDAASTTDSRPKPVTGVVSGGQAFDGKDDGLDVAEGYNFNWKANESFSIELWMRTEASTSGNRVLIGRDAKDSEAHWWLGVDGNGLAGFQLKDLSWQGELLGGSGSRLNDGKWHQLVAVRNGSSSLTELYVDGEKVAERAFTYTYGFESNSPVNIGYMNDGNGYHYEGVLDEVKLFGRALSSAEVWERYTAVYDAITELVRFEGDYNSGTVLLTWQTAAEAGLLNFEVQRAPDTENFEPLGTVEAAGNSNTPLTYNFTDTAPLPDRAYYRLKINNAKGTHTYSNIIMVEHGGPSATFFKVYPNPTTLGDVYGELSNLPPGEVVTYFVADLSGRKLLEAQAEVDEFGQLKLTIPITEKYRSGIYNVCVVSSKRILGRKLMVSR